MCLLPIENVFCRNIFKFRNPFFDVLTIRIIFFSLHPRVENSDLSWISANTSNILPISSILRWRIINKFLCKIFLSFFPVNEQIFNKERGNILSCSVVHVSSWVHLSYSSINKRDSSNSFFPFLQPLLIVVPF